MYRSNHGFGRIDIPMIEQKMTKATLLNIGNDAILGARVVVIKAIPNYAIVAGNPENIVIKQRLGEMI